MPVKVAMSRAWHGLLEQYGSILVYKHLLIATDGSELAQKAVEQGLALAKALNAKVTAVNVSESWTAIAPGEVAIAFPPAEYEKSAAANAAQVLTGVTDAAQKMGVSCDAVHVKDQFPAEGIIETAKACGCDVIVMASHGRRGLMRLVLGSQASRVVAHSAVPVLVCR
jgi:nucleotide-binding universal stress UspA family protein